MNLKRHSVLLALLLLTVLLTACAQPAEKPSEDALYTTEKAAPPIWRFWMWRGITRPATLWRLPGRMVPCPI